MTAEEERTYHTGDRDSEEPASRIARVQGVPAESAARFLAARGAIAAPAFRAAVEAFLSDERAPSGSAL
jgi:hypothetical protein